MRDVCRLICLALIGLLRSRASLQAEILTLRHQLNVLRRKSPQRLAFTSIDRLVFAGLYRLAPGVLDVLKIVRAETVIRWHRAGFRAYWRWKSRPRSGRPKTPLEIRQLIREMSLAKPIMGRTTASRRASQARHRCRTNHRCKVYGEGKATAVPRVEDIPSESRRRHRVDRPIRGSDNLIPTALRAAATASRSPPNPVAGSDCAPNG